MSYPTAPHPHPILLQKLLTTCQHYTVLLYYITCCCYSSLITTWLPQGFFLHQLPQLSAVLETTKLCQVSTVTNVMWYCMISTITLTQFLFYLGFAVYQHWRSATIFAAALGLYYCTYRDLFICKGWSSHHVWLCVPFGDFNSFRILFFWIPSANNLAFCMH